MALHTAEQRTGTALLAAGVLLVAVTAALAGCVQQRPPAPPGQAIQTGPDKGFSLTRNRDEGVKLVYGRPGADDVDLMLKCQPGSREVDIIDIDHPKARKGQMLTLTSGNVQSALSPTLEPNEEGGGVMVDAHVTTGLPALEGFRRTGQIAVKLGGREYALIANAGEKAKITEFFSACERK